MYVGGGGGRGVPLAAPERRQVRLWITARQAEICSRRSCGGIRAAGGRLWPGRSRGHDPSVGTTSHTRKTAPGDGWFTRSGARPGLPLLVVLVVQAAACRCGWSVPIRRSRTRRHTCGPGIWSGRTGCTGTPIPPFSSYFSGAPVIYPPLGALADSVGGLAGARLLSLAFMLGATVLLWSVTAGCSAAGPRSSPRRCSPCAGPTLHLGAFATYDAMSLFLLALAAWLVVGAARTAGGDRPDGRGRRGAGAGQRHGLLLGPVRPGRRGPGAAHRAARSGGRIAAAPLRVPGDRAGRAAPCGSAARREHLLARDQPDDADPGRGRRLPAARCSPTPGPGPASSSSWPCAASSPAGPAAGAPRGPGCWPS